MLTRRDALRGGTATVAVIAGAGAVAARVAVEDPVLVLERQWQVMREESERRTGFLIERMDQRPAWAQPGPSGLGFDWGWPDVSDLPEFKDLCGSSALANRPTLEMVEKYNRHAEICADDDLEGLAKVKAEGRARVRALEARHQEKKDLERELGIHDWDERQQPHTDRMHELEEQMIGTPALTVAGIAAKLRYWKYYEDPTQPGIVERSALSALRDAERLAGRALS